MGGAPAAAAPAAGGRPGSGGRRLSRMEASARADEAERRMNTGERRGREVSKDEAERSRESTGSISIDTIG